MNLFPPETFARNTASPTAVVRTFAVPAIQGSFVLKVQNGPGTGDNAVSSAVVKVNGVAIVKTSDFSQQTTSVERPVTNVVKGTNTLEVEVRSIPSSYISVSIAGTYLLGVTITDPAPGVTVSSDRVTVKGSWVGYTSDVGVAVNGVPAAISGNSFVANVVSFTYSAPGKYTAGITLVDGSGLEYTSTRTIVSQDRAAVDDLLSGRWHGLSLSLEAQDIPGGLVHLLPESRAKYQAIFAPLAAQLPTIFSSVSRPELIAVKENVAQYRVRREQLWQGVVRTITYYVWFAKDQDGVWRIDAF